MDINDIKPKTEYKTTRELPGLLAAGTTVKTEKGGDQNNLLIGKTGLISCLVPRGGALFFDAKDLEPV